MLTSNAVMLIQGLVETSRHNSFFYRYSLNLMRLFDSIFYVMAFLFNQEKKYRTKFVGQLDVKRSPVSTGFLSLTFL